MPSMVTTDDTVKAAASLVEATKTFGGTAALSKATIHLIPGDGVAMMFVGHRMDEIRTP